MPVKLTSNFLPPPEENEEQTLKVKKFYVGWSKLIISQFLEIQLKQKRSKNLTCSVRFHLDEIILACSTVLEFNEKVMNTQNNKLRRRAFQAN